MKKKIQKYLAGEREGFSLVELIIVIAIMAILIGVIALAVIPNIGRSRESKDLQALDNILSATNTAIANLKMTGASSDFLEYKDDSGDESENKVIKAVYDELGVINLGAGCNDGTTKIYIKWETAGTAAAKITVQAAKTKGTANTCTYTKDDNSNPVTMEVTSGNSAIASSSSD